jgi:heavy metal sensor kinase
MNTRSLRFRMTAWYASLLAGALVLFSASVYIGLRQYLDLSLQRLLIEEARSIGDELLINLPDKGPAWLKSEINEHYAPGVNGRFISVKRSDGAVVYLSDHPTNASFDPHSISVHSSAGAKEYSTRVEIPGKHQLAIEQLSFSMPDGSQYWVAVGAPYQQVETVLHGLLVTLTGYLPLIISLAIGGGYWLTRRALRPIETITRQAEGITSTNLSQRLPVIQTGDELERLSKSLNGMITRLEKAFQHINRFSADASHELRTPLTILQLELESIAQHHQLPVHLADQIGSALEETQRLSRIVENLLTISRLDAGEGRMEKVRVDIGNIATSTAEQMHLLAEEKSISMRGNAAEEVWVEGDRSRLKQVVVNLIDNAIKYTPHGGMVIVTVSTDDRFARLEVGDNGIGIAPQALPYIFERFYRADKARSRESGGSGLGLAIVKAICSAHGGEVKVVSREGLGSNFIVELPLCEPGRTRKPDHRATPKDAMPRTWTAMSGKSLRT